MMDIKISFEIKMEWKFIGNFISLFRTKRKLDSTVTVSIIYALKVFDERAREKVIKTQQGSID